SQCYSVPTSTLTVIVQDVVQPGTIAADQTICYSGDPSALTSGQDGSGSGTITYRWEASAGGGPWTVITGATGPTFDPAGPITVTARYRRIAVSTVNLVPCESVPTNLVTITVLPEMVPPTASA